MRLRRVTCLDGVDACTGMEEPSRCSHFRARMTRKWQSEVLALCSSWRWRCTIQKKSRVVALRCHYERCCQAQVLSTRIDLVYALSRDCYRPQKLRTWDFSLGASAQRHIFATCFYPLLDAHQRRVFRRGGGRAIARSVTILGHICARVSHDIGKLRSSVTV